MARSPTVIEQLPPKTYCMCNIGGLNQVLNLAVEIKEARESEKHAGKQNNHPGSVFTYHDGSLPIDSLYCQFTLCFGAFVLERL